jgi:hypothetical protein
MYFSVSTKNKDPDFSWIIVKNPNSTFSRNLSGEDCTVTAKFENEQTFAGHVQNSPLTFLEIARKLNMGNYLHAQLSAVCPHNLRGFDTTFRSALRGNFTASELPEEKYFAPKFFTAILGPCHRKERKMLLYQHCEWFYKTPYLAFKSN